MDQDQVRDMFLNKKTYENRRRMAWVSLFAIIGIAIGAFLFPTSIVSITAVIDTVLMTLGAVILTYMGTTMLPVAFANKKASKQMPQQDTGEQ